MHEQICICCCFSSSRIKYILEKNKHLPFKERRLRDGNGKADGSKNLENISEPAGGAHNVPDINFLGSAASPAVAGSFTTSPTSATIITSNDNEQGIVETDERSLLWNQIRPFNYNAFIGTKWPGRLLMIAKVSFHIY